jgi:hypothetical protein
MSPLLHLASRHAILALHTVALLTLDPPAFSLSIDLPNGTFSPLPFDVNKAENCMGYIRIPRGTRCALYVHGRAPGAVVYRHPVRDMNWDFEETFHRYGLDPVIEPRTGEAVQYRYEPQGARCACSALVTPRPSPASAAHSDRMILRFVRIGACPLSCRRPSVTFATWILTSLCTFLCRQA